MRNADQLLNNLNIFQGHFLGLLDGHVPLQQTLPLPAQLPLDATQVGLDSSVISTESVPVAPSLSVTVRVYVAGRESTVTVRVPPLPIGLAPIVHSYFWIVPSGSEEPVPSNVTWLGTAVTVCGLALATAIGSWLEPGGCVGGGVFGSDRAQLNTC